MWHIVIKAEGLGKKIFRIGGIGRSMAPPPCLHRIGRWFPDTPRFAITDTDRHLDACPAVSP